MEKATVEKRIGFDDIPVVMAELVDQVKLLNDRILMMEEENTKRLSEPKKKILTTDQVCRMLHRSRASVYRLVAREMIPYIKQGKTLGFYEDEIIEWLNGFSRYLQGICALTPSHVSSRTDLLARLAGRMSREVVHFSYTKTDGSLRHAYGTLSWDIVSRFVDPERIVCEHVDRYSAGLYIHMYVIVAFCA